MTAAAVWAALEPGDRDWLRTLAAQAGSGARVALVGGAVRDALLGAFARPPKRLRAVVAHAAAFPTWRSLCVENGLTDKEAVEAMLTLVIHTAQARPR